jgi:hypothetical protein
MLNKILVILVKLFGLKFQESFIDPHLHVNLMPLAIAFAIFNAHF